MRQRQAAEAGTLTEQMLQVPMLLDRRGMDGEGMIQPGPSWAAGPYSSSSLSFCERSDLRWLAARQEWLKAEAEMMLAWLRSWSDCCYG